VHFGEGYLEALLRAIDGTSYPRLNQVHHHH